ncbi:hypothetical protein J7T55_015676 [Diaporthe amygdali]|uniref:uncharacterized protein n=1 Tax=Phomopsis amygdali TaxID=1214568 RepID=UPI0022FDC1C0|nr:uncharacterized protein J7T55_015676 [Diaporthe amygdali]KAJ0120938.1 hypothetical protein J7T55_015676 [Diaporthe amygdali]
MTTLKIEESDIPQLDGQTAIVTGGSSGIGLATAKIIASRGGKVIILDIHEPKEKLPVDIRYQKCDIGKWSELIAAFSSAGPTHIAVANAGQSEDGSYLTDSYDEHGNLLEPTYNVIDTNFRGTLNFVKLALHSMRKHDIKGSIVITSSATAYSAEQSLPVYSGTKAALINYLRAMRSTLRGSGITINAVAPAATITGLLPAELAAPIMAAGLPVSTAHFVGLAVVYSAVASEEQKVAAYGKDSEEWKQAPGRWNGRTILTLGQRYTELEGPISDLRNHWFGDDNLRETQLQQAATDFRDTI